MELRVGRTPVSGRYMIVFSAANIARGSRRLVFGKGRVSVLASDPCSRALTDRLRRACEQMAMLRLSSLAKGEVVN